MGIMDKLKKSRAKLTPVVETIHEPSRTSRNIPDEEIAILKKYQKEIDQMRAYLLRIELPDSGYEYIKSSSGLALSILDTIITHGCSTPKQDKAVLNCYNGIKKWYDRNLGGKERETTTVIAKRNANEFQHLLGDL